MTAEPRPPHPLLMLAEGRVVAELAAFYAARRWLVRLPRGDGHPVLVLPGFLASDFTTAPLRHLLRDLGYQVHGWGLGRNVRVDLARVRAMEALLQRLHQEAGRKVSLIGWSLGGLFARELAKLHPGSVRQVITLGSPIRDDRRHTSVTRLFEWLNGKEPEPIRHGHFVGLDQPPPVPCTTILSRSDGIVHWRGAVQPDGSPHCENVVVSGSHCGLPVNPAVIAVLADRLRQPEGTWHPFTPPPAQRWLFPQQKVS